MKAPETYNKILKNIESIENCTIYKSEKSGFCGAVYKSGSNFKLEYIRNFSSKKPRALLYSKQENAVKAAESLIVKYNEIQDYKDSLKKERKVSAEKNSLLLAEGAILETSWCYEQTNLDFYKILSRHGNNVVIVPMSKELVDANCGMSGYFVAGKEIPENAFNAKIHLGSIKDESGYKMRLWNGKPSYCSWYY